jgi:hypothetical protein
MNWYVNYGKKSRYYMSLAGSNTYIPIILSCSVLFLVSNLLSISYAIEPTIIRQSVIDDPLD